MSLSSGGERTARQVQHGPPGPGPGPGADASLTELPPSVAGAIAGRLEGQQRHCDGRGDTPISGSLYIRPSRRLGLTVLHTACRQCLLGLCVWRCGVPGCVPGCGAGRLCVGCVSLRTQPCTQVCARPCVTAVFLAAAPRAGRPGGFDPRSCAAAPRPNTCQPTAAAGIIHRHRSCKP